MPGELLREAVGVRAVEGFSQLPSSGDKWTEISFILENTRLTRCSQGNSLKGNVVLPRFCIPCLCRGVGSHRAPWRTVVSVREKASVPCAQLKHQQASAGCRRLQRGFVITACLQAAL